MKWDSFIHNRCNLFYNAIRMAWLNNVNDDICMYVYHWQWCDTDEGKGGGVALV